ncbi:MAG: hypothetical protein M3406_16650 [Chloroflexota bacterium]|nr:hypothetical protein [Chloroflexota bacterium]
MSQQENLRMQKLMGIDLAPRHLAVLGLAMLLVLSSVTAAFAGRNDEQAIRREGDGAVEGAAVVDDDDEDALDDEDDALATDVSTGLEDERSLLLASTNGTVDEDTLADVTVTDGVDTEAELAPDVTDAEDTAAETADD